MGVVNAFYSNLLNDKLIEYNTVKGAQIMEKARL